MCVCLFCCDVRFNPLTISEASSGFTSRNPNMLLLGFLTLICKQVNKRGERLQLVPQEDVHDQCRSAEDKYLKQTTVDLVWVRVCRVQGLEGSRARGGSGVRVSVLGLEQSEESIQLHIWTVLGPESEGGTSCSFSLLSRSDTGSVRLRGERRRFCMLCSVLARSWSRLSSCWVSAITLGSRGAEESGAVGEKKEKVTDVRRCGCDGGPICSSGVLPDLLAAAWLSPLCGSSETPPEQLSSF